jgi:hypothetical protein
MKEIDRKLKRAIRRRRKQRLPGIHNEVCIGCAGDIASGKKVDDHIAGWKSDDTVWPLCVKCDQSRQEMQYDDEPPRSVNPRNVFEVIGRWLLALAEYFELMRNALTRFGMFLIGLAQQGYGAELQLA